MISKNIDTNKNQIGLQCKIFRDVIISASVLRDNVSIGDFSIVRESHLEEQTEIGRRNTVDHVRIGKGTYTGEFCMMKYCSIGKYCAISWNVSIGGANHDINHLAVTSLNRVFRDEPLQYRSFIEEKVEIGNDVWIAAGAHILRGVTIGDGAVIAANAVVTSNVAPYSIVGGVPAKKIGQRFDDDTIDRLLSIKWWDWNDDQFMRAKNLFSLPMDESVLRQMEAI